MALEGHTINIGNREGLIIYTTTLEDILYAVLSFSDEVKDTEVYCVHQENDELVFKLEKNKDTITTILEKLTASTLDESDWK